MNTVYFIKPVGMFGPVKIGCSSMPYVRLEALELWSPFPLQMVAKIDGDARLERRFHAKFYDSHTKHEWFVWSRELQATIDQINAGEFDIQSLPEAKHLPRKRRA